MKPWLEHGNGILEAIAFILIVTGIVWWIVN
jgi:hypothetical protein